MENVCPVCNSLSTYLVKCQSCSNVMESKGAIQEYFDDYSADLDKEITEKKDGASSEKCVHLFYCPQCLNDKRVSIEKKLM